MKSITQVVENLIKTYIDSHDRAAEAIIAPVETDATSASDDYAVGKQLILSNVLYDVIAPITAGDALVVNTNIKAADNVSSGIEAKQPKTLDTPITVGGVQQTTVEGALGSINQTLTNNVSDINTALSNEIATRAKVSGHNLLPNKIVSGTYGGAQFTVNADKSVTISQTTEDNVAVSLTDSLKLEAGNYILSGGIDENCVVDIQVDGQYYSSTGEDTPFTVGANSTIGFVRLTIYGARAVSGTFYPMIRLATDADPTYQPYAMTNQELTPIAQAVSNRNLLDNPWFTVNQRGQATYTSAGIMYTVDRWMFINTDMSLTVNNDGTITITNNGDDVQGLWQMLENPLPIGNYSTDLIGSNLENLSSMAFYDASYNLIVACTNENKIAVLPSANCTRIAIYVKANTSITLRAVKIERGTISTLAQDTAPNYAEELLKCQRYYQRIGKGNWFKGQNAGRMWLGHQFNVDMRTIPTIDIITQAVTFYGMIADGNVTTTAITKGISEVDGSGIGYLELLVTSADTITDKSMYTADRDFLEVSADL